MVANLTTHRNGTVADGISKLILIVESKSSLQFSIKDTRPDNTTNGTLSSLKQASKDDNNSSTTAKDSPHNISNGKSVVAVVYTPPDSFNQDKVSNRTINVNVSDSDKPSRTLIEIPIHIYRPPIVLIHGLWMNLNNTWVTTKFANVKSYAIAGTYRPNAKKSHNFQESYYQTVVDSNQFNLDKDGFDDYDNDLVVSVTSQLGGLRKQIRKLSSNDIPDHSAVYRNTVHDCFYIKDNHKDVFSEINSPYIQKDVIKLLSYCDNDKFANAIGIHHTNA